MEPPRQPQAQPDVLGLPGARDVGDDGVADGDVGAEVHVGDDVQGQVHAELCEARDHRIEGGVAVPAAAHVDAGPAEGQGQAGLEFPVQA